MAVGSFKAARDLRRLQQNRGCVSRLYYSVFSAATAEIRKRVTAFPNGYQHPPHRELSRYIKKYLTQFSRAKNDALRDAITRLYSARLDADYNPSATVDVMTARDATIHATFVLEELGYL